MHAPNSFLTPTLQEPPRRAQRYTLEHRSGGNRCRDISGGQEGFCGAGEAAVGRQGPRWQWLGREKEGGMNPVQGREMLRCFCCQASGFVVSPQLCSVFGSLFRPLLMPSTARCMFRCFVLALKPGLPSCPQVSFVDCGCSLSCAERMS